MISWKTEEWNGHLFTAMGKQPVTARRKAVQAFSTPVAQDSKLVVLRVFPYAFQVISTVSFSPLSVCHESPEDNVVWIGLTKSTFLGGVLSPLYATGKMRTKKS
jgi:hypothetical protein